MANPFHLDTDQDRHYIWQRLVQADSDAFVTGDWSMIEDDFDAANFEGVRAYGSGNPDDWKVAFADLSSYRENWLAASREFQKKRFLGLSLRQAIYQRTRLNEIGIVGERALAHKKFSGDLPLEDGTMLSGGRQTIYRLHKHGGAWKIVGFIGYLPL